MKKKNLFLLIGFLVLAVFLFGKNLNARSYVYVDVDASGTKDGSKDHPYDSIQDGINRAEKKDRDVFIYNGTYKESIEIWSDVELVGEDEKKVIIDGKNTKPVATMYDDSEIHNLTLTDGLYGVRVKKGAHVVINDCRIVDNIKDGIKAKSADLKEKEQLEVYDSYIAKNGGSGLYSEARKLVFENNEVEENGKDGLDLAAGSEAYIRGNRFVENDGVGMKLVIDRSDVYAKRNTFYDNDRDGVEVAAHAADGFVNLKENKFYKNDRWGVARVERGTYSDSRWNKNLVIENSNFWQNKFGDMSSFVIVY